MSVQATPIPPRNRAYVKLCWARPAKPVKFVCHSRRVTGVMMHWDGVRSVLCQVDPHVCEWCRQRRQKIWYGWVSGFSIHDDAAALIQIPKLTVQTSLVLSDPKTDLRGATILLERMGAMPRARVRADVRLADRPPQDQEEPDTLLRLQHVYNLFARGDGEIDRGQS